MTIKDFAEIVKQFVEITIIFLFIAVCYELVNRFLGIYVPIKIIP